MTRSIITATVSFIKHAKGENGITQEPLEETLVKCDSREKAEIILCKEHKGALIEITGIQFVKTVRKISEQDFLEHSTVVSEEIIEM